MIVQLAARQHTALAWLRMRTPQFVASHDPDALFGQFRSRKLSLTTYEAKFKLSMGFARPGAPSFSTCA
jgi:hypothetical protein